MSLTRRTSIKKQKTYAWCNMAKASTLHTNSYQILNQIQAQGQGACSVLFRASGAGAWMRQKKKSREGDQCTKEMSILLPS
jgi:hypothetical protein